MKRLYFLGFSTVGIFPLSCGAAQTSTQVAPLLQEQVVLSKLSNPIYPPLARAARVSGDVEIALRIRQDGSVESAEVVRGHPLLKARGRINLVQRKHKRTYLTPTGLLMEGDYESVRL